MDTSKEVWNEYERVWTANIVQSINAMRNELGLTIKQLRIRLYDLGWPISDATLSGMLSADKRTSISIGEIAVFASALSVPPMYLILGLPKAKDMPTNQLWDEGELDIYEGAAWFFGVYRSAYDKADIPIARVAKSAVNYVTFASEVLDKIMLLLTKLWALLEVQDVDDSWREAEIKTIRSKLQTSFSYLRRLRNSHKKDSVGQTVNDLHVMPLPPGMDFVDSNSDLAIDISGLNSEYLVAICPEAARVRAITGIEAQYEKYLQDNQYKLDQ